MFDKKNILRYAPKEQSMDALIPSKQYIPEWYKSIKGYNKNNIEFSNDNRVVKNVKSCIPFLDSLTSGYMVELWCDVHFRIDDKKDGLHYVTWSEANPVPIAIRNPESNPVPVPAGCEPTHYVWKFPYCIKTPKDYSLLLTHPLNRFDLPFITLSGIVDAEKTMGMGNFPFFVKKDFEGVIEKGTPIIQIIPFKTENWVAQKDISVLQEGLNNNVKSNNMFYGFYKNNMWKKKKYE